MYLFFDTETSGLSYKKDQLQETDPAFPRVMQLACMLTDSSFNIIASFYSPLKVPDFLHVDPRAFEAHGLTKEFCNQNGTPPEVALLIFQSMRNAATFFCGHNISFDIGMIQSEEKYCFGASQFNPPEDKQICTMKQMTDICKLPHAKWKNKYKWPKLAEAYEYCMKKPLEDAHDSFNDLKACVEIVRWLKNENTVLSPS